MVISTPLTLCAKVAISLYNVLHECQLLTPFLTGHCMLDHIRPNFCANFQVLRYNRTTTTR